MSQLADGFLFAAGATLFFAAMGVAIDMVMRVHERAKYHQWRREQKRKTGTK